MSSARKRASHLLALVPLLTAATGLLATSPSWAATALVEPSETFFGQNTLRYIADPGETNTVTMTPAAPEVEITDAGATITAGAGCTSLDPNTVRCGHESGWIEVLLGDGDDVLKLSRVRLDGAVFRGQDGNDTLVTGGGSDSLERLFGGPGNDILRGRRGSDFLNEGPGADILSGGTSVDYGGLRIFTPSIDTVTYAGRTSDVFADPDGVADDGEAGEGDMLEDDVEELIGGSGDDVLVGTTAEGRIRVRKDSSGACSMAAAGTTSCAGHARETCSSVVVVRTTYEATAVRIGLKEGVETIGLSAGRVETRSQAGTAGISFLRETAARTGSTVGPGTTVRGLTWTSIASVASKRSCKGARVTTSVAWAREA